MAAAAGRFGLLLPMRVPFFARLFGIRPLAASSTEAQTGPGTGIADPLNGPRLEWSRLFFGGLLGLGGLIGCANVEATELPPDAPPASADGPLDLDDVSILYPLPKSPASDELLRASLDLGGQTLLSRSLAARLPLLQEDTAITYDTLRVVSVRLEPCFREAGARQDACKRQVRFVLQPLAVSEKSEVITLDAAAHVFYEVGTETFVSLVRALENARPRTPKAPLGVHRTLAQEGLAGPFARLLRTQLTTAIAKGELVRVTFMTVRGRGNEWQFGGYRVSQNGSVVEPLGVAPSQARIQSLVLQTTENTFVKSIAPQIAVQELSPLLDALAMRAASPEARESALRAANRIENPDLRSSEDTDCASCHTTASSTRWAETNLRARSDADRFASPSFDLSVLGEKTASDPATLRAFGYIGGAPYASPRTIHDSAKAARITNALLAEN